MSLTIFKLRKVNYGQTLNVKQYRFGDSPSDESTVCCYSDALLRGAKLSSCWTRNLYPLRSYERKTFVSTICLKHLWDADTFVFTCACRGLVLLLVRWLFHVLLKMSSISNSYYSRDTKNACLRVLITHFITNMKQ